MKKELYDFLCTDLQFVKGVGPVLAARFDELLGGRRIIDFLLHVPRAVKSRPPVESILNAKVGEIITVPLEIQVVKRAAPARAGRRPPPTQIFGYDKMGGQVILQFFGSNFLDYWLEKLPVGSWRMISGKLEANGDRFVISHPDFIEPLDAAGKIPAFQAIYPTGSGLTQRIMANIRDQVFNNFQFSIFNFQFFDLLKSAHYPEADADVTPESDTMRRLAYSELFANQLAIALARQTRAANACLRPAPVARTDFYKKMFHSLSFELTGAQKRTLDEITADMSADHAMMRLVQGDVGSGKTVVGLMAMMRSLDRGDQSVLLAPTDALAQQHFSKLKPMLDCLGIVSDILTGRDKGAGRHDKLVSMKSGRTKILFGTHALFSPDVGYKSLGLAVIDEQHRFGVAQRTLMAAKGKFVDILALSATPIPRTLSMTIYGDMEISVINEKPAGRLPIITTMLPSNRVAALIERMKHLIFDSKCSSKAFWVCPLIEESEGSNTMNVEARAKELARHFKVGLVHGQMDKKDRDIIMENFAHGDLDILVATSVIEVGIDVSNAKVMVVENAECFGLSALHQLRGRVGRGSTQSYCILLHGYGLSENGQKRLQILCDTDDGFAIAEQDLMMRGTGEILGTRQSGWLNYRFVDVRAHRDLFKFAIEKSKEMVISGSISEEARDLMWIFGQMDKMELVKG